MCWRLYFQQKWFSAPVVILAFNPQAARLRVSELKCVLCFYIYLSQLSKNWFNILNSCSCFLFWTISSQIDFIFSWVSNLKLSKLCINAVSSISLTDAGNNTLSNSEKREKTNAPIDFVFSGIAISFSDLYPM